MKPLLFHILFGLLSGCLCLGNEKAIDFEHGVRPPNGVFDPLGLLDAHTLRQIEEPLTPLLQEEKIEVIVVVLDDLGGAPPEFIARRFADAWCSSPVHAVVLHVPGNEDSPWIDPRGTFLERMPPNIVRERVTQAKRNAAREPTEADKVRAASVEAADMLRFWTGGTAMVDAMVREARQTHMHHARNENKVRGIRAYLLVGGGILLVIATLVLLTVRRKPKRRIFPEFKIPSRMGAPHAGGNHATVALLPPDSTES